MEKLKLEMQPDLQPEVHALYEQTTGTWQYIVACPLTKHCVIIDPMLDASKSKSAMSSVAADNIMSIIGHYGYRVDRILQTHTHPDRPSAMWYLRTQLRDVGQDPRVNSKSTEGIRRLFARKYGMNDPGFTAAVDSDLSDGEFFRIGELKVNALRLPGHTADQVGFMIGRNVFAGDAIPHDGGKNIRPNDRPNEPGAEEEARGSIERILRLSPDYRIYKGHDQFLASSKTEMTLVPFLTVGEHRARVGAPPAPPTRADAADGHRSKPKAGRGVATQRRRAVHFTESEVSRAR